MRAELSAHRVRTHRHLRYSTEVTDIEETLLMLTGRPDDLVSIESVELAGHTIRFDHATQTAHHAHHSDPAIVFETTDGHHLQVFFHALPPTRSNLELQVVRAGATQTVDVTWSKDASRPTLSTRTIVGMTSSPRVEIACGEDVEIIFQRLQFGRITEERFVLPAGEHEVPIPPAFSDAFGVAVSTSGLLHGIEHKHMILGKFGAPSGRDLLTGGETITHGIDEEFSYRAAIAVTDSAGWPGGMTEPWIGFDEIDVWCKPEQKPAMLKRMQACPIPWNITTFGMDGDVVVLPPGASAPPEQPCSYLLFSDADDFGFQERIEGLLERLPSMPDDHRCLDVQWLAANRAPANDRPRYGIAFSTPTAEPLTKARVRQFKAERLTGYRVQNGLAASLPFPAGEL